MRWTTFGISAPPLCDEIHMLGSCWEVCTVKKIKRWLIERILPVWARESLLAEIEDLKRQNTELRHELALRNEYISGLEAGIRAQRRIVINTVGGEKK